MKFVDEIEIVIASGKGGAGSVSFRREAMTPRGGPDGGDGGRGGDVILEARDNVNSLVDFRHNKRYAAQDGRPGEGSNRSGPAGNDLVLIVPKGTVVRTETGSIVVDMTNTDRFTILKGGRGGKGNTFFKTSVNQAPDRAQPGEPGQELRVQMELKLIADVGIIGLPNAGKSTLISRISAARPKIADYPFTTLVPNLGVVKVGDYQSFVVADIPGLIRGAHTGAGLGIQFLKHIERTRIFVHLLDVSGGDIEQVVSAYKDINFELAKYDESNAEEHDFVPLSKREQLIAFSKTETLSPEALARLEWDFERQTGVKPLKISAVTGLNIEALVRSLWEIVSKKGPNVL